MKYNPSYYTINHFHLYQIVVSGYEEITLIGKIYNNTLEENQFFHLFSDYTQLAFMLQHEDIFPDFILEKTIEFLSHNHETDPYNIIDIEAITSLPLLINQFNFSVYQSLYAFDNDQLLPYAKGEFIVDSIELI